MYAYQAIVLSVVDGDTIECAVDLGFRLTTTQRFRLSGYNAPELTGAERPLGLMAREHLSSLLVGHVIDLRSYKGDSFGRWVADIELPNGGGDLVTHLIRDGWGVEWTGKAPRPTFDLLSDYPNPQPNLTT